MTPLSNHDSYLPSYESRIVSESRVARINELYNKTKKKYHEHRDSVISNNSTSVQDVGLEDHCHPLSNVPNPDDVHILAQGPPTVTIKAEPPSNPFHPPVHENKTSPEENYEEELQFTPKLRSKKSIISFRSSRHSTPLSHGKSTAREDRSFGVVQEPLFFSTDNKRRVMSRRDRLKELKGKLGNPVPLDYLNQDGPADVSSLLERRQEIEDRWKRILSSDKGLNHQKLQNISHAYESRNNSSVFSDGDIVADSSVVHNNDIPNSSNNKLDDISEEVEKNHLSISIDQISDIREGIRNNSERLDKVIELLGEKNSNNRREVVFWGICIIILILLNIYVYKL